MKNQDTMPKFKVELTYAEIVQLAGMVSLHWVKTGMIDKDARVLAEKLGTIRKELNLSALN